LTTPKIKDYIYSPTKSYDEIFKTLSSSEDTTLINNLTDNSSKPDDKEKMKYDLKTFLKNQIQG